MTERQRKAITRKYDIARAGKPLSDSDALYAYLRSSSIAYSNSSGYRGDGYRTSVWNEKEGRWEPMWKWVYPK
jgi:hypothetical protein